MILPVEQGEGEVREGEAGPGRPGLYDVDPVAPVVGEGGAYVKGALAVVGPRFPGVGGVERDDQLARGVDGVGVKVDGEVVYACPGGEGGVGGVGSEVVEGEFGKGDEFVPLVGGKVGVGGGEDSNEVVLGGAYVPLRGKGSVDAGGDKLDG